MGWAHYHLCLSSTDLLEAVACTYREATLLLTTDGSSSKATAVRCPCQKVAVLLTAKLYLTICIHPVLSILLEIKDFKRNWKFPFAVLHLKLQTCTHGNASENNSFLTGCISKAVPSVGSKSHLASINKESNQIWNSKSISCIHCGCRD